MLTMNADASPQGTADHFVGVSSQTPAHNPLLSNVIEWLLTIINCLKQAKIQTYSAPAYDVVVW